MSETELPSTVRVVVFTHRGLVRDTNEDCLGVAGWLTSNSTAEPYEFSFDCGPNLVFLVADGLGGHAAGAAASHFAVAKFTEQMLADVPVTEDTIYKSLEVVNHELAELMNGSLHYRGAGTTVAGVAVTNGRVIVFNVGDSRVYRRQEQFLEQLTKDDRAQALQPELSESVARPSNMLLQCLGGVANYRPVSAHVLAVPLTQTEQFLLCTDGLTDAVSLDAMESAISPTPLETVKSLRDLVLKAGAPDNFSIVMLQFG